MDERFFNLQQQLKEAKTSSGGGSRGARRRAREEKRSEEQQGSEGNAKKSKSESSSPTSSLKLPKVKLGDKITALQQIVSPFGRYRTDTASVLYEAINYIKWLHEQVQ
ncbi:hypothetical protein EJB05_12761, partial [Eragrostis curvula]